MLPLHACTAGVAVSLLLYSVIPTPATAAAATATAATATAATATAATATAATATAAARISHMD
jgi:hypothetical protein